jgi:hypothetical protein
VYAKAALAAEIIAAARIPAHIVTKILLDLQVVVRTIYTLSGLKGSATNEYTETYAVFAA